MHPTDAALHVVITSNVILPEIQLKPHHKPFHVRREWRTLLSKYSSAEEDQLLKDEPIVSFQRNVFFSKKDEMKIRCEFILKSFISRCNDGNI